MEGRTKEQSHINLHFPDFFAAQKESFQPIKPVPHITRPIPTIVHCNLCSLPPQFSASPTHWGSLPAANQSTNPHSFGIWEETGALWEIPHSHENNMETPQRQHQRLAMNPGPWGCEQRHYLLHHCVVHWCGIQKAAALMDLGSRV